MIDTTVALSLLDAWDDQQSALVAMRDERFDTMLWVLERMLSDEEREDDGRDLVVLDAACGPGAIARRILEHFPKARVIAVDLDPSLLEIARSALLPSFGDRLTVIEADLSGDWQSLLPPDAPGRIDAAVSATALHWLMPGGLVDFYTRLARVLRKDGIFMNADHLRYDSVIRPGLARLSQQHDLETQAEEYRNGALSWKAWWAAAGEIPELSPLIEERDRRFAREEPVLRASTEFHLEALMTAGFSESGILSQYLDNLLVYGRR